MYGNVDLANALPESNQNAESSKHTLECTPEQNPGI
jgi:hypothetical protein